MDPVEFIRKHPQEAESLFLKWQELTEKYPELLLIETESEISAWAKKHPEIDTDILKEALDGKKVWDSYNDLRREHENQQMEEKKEIDKSVSRADIPHIYHLETAYNQQPRIMEDDKDYQKIREDLKKQWHKQNPNKGFTSKEGTGYLYWSLEDENAPTLTKDAEKIFRERYPKKANEYDEKEKLIYKNPLDDPRVIHLRNTVAEHIKARKKLPGTPVDIGLILENQASVEFNKKHSDKTRRYTKSGFRVVEAERKRGEERKKTLIERLQDTYNLYRKSEQGVKIARSTGRFAEKTVLGVARTVGRTALQGGRATAIGIRTTIQSAMFIGRGGAVLLSNPIGWLVIGVVIAIMLIVFLIIMFAGGGGITGEKPVPTIECLDPDGDVIAVTNGNTCAENLAGYYSNTEGSPVIAVCLDKCTDFVKNTCDRDAGNACDPLLTACGAPQASFCIEYTPADVSLDRLYDCATGGPGYANFAPGCGSTPTPSPTSTIAPTIATPTPTLTPTLTPLPLNRAQIIADAQAVCSSSPSPDTRWCVGMAFANLGLIDDPSPIDYVNSLPGTSGWSWDQGYDWWIASGKIIGA